MVRIEKLAALKGYDLELLEKYLRQSKHKYRDTALGIQVSEYDIEEIDKGFQEYYVPFREKKEKELAENIVNQEKEKQQREEEKRQREEERHKKEEFESMMKKMIVTTCPSVEGYIIEEYDGLVFGEAIFKPGFLKSIGAMFNDTVDQLSFGDRELSGTTKIMKDARNFAINKLKYDAAEKGANAVVGVDCETTLGIDIMRITISGTAVRIKKNM